METSIKYLKLEQFPQHLSTLQKVNSVFVKLPEVVGLFLYGSVAEGEIDQFSDLDLLVITQNKTLNKCWQERRIIEVNVDELLFHFDLEEIMETSCVGIYKNGIKVHFTYIDEDSLEVSDEYQNCVALFNKSDAVSMWIEACRNYQRTTNSDLFIRIDRDFWFWLLQGSTKLCRGEYWAAYDTLHILRTNLVAFIENLNATRFRAFRKLEFRWEENELGALAKTLSSIDRQGLLFSYRWIITVYMEKREVVSKNIGVKWEISSELIIPIVDATLDLCASVKR